MDSNYPSPLRKWVESIHPSALKELSLSWMAEFFKDLWGASEEDIFFGAG